MSYQPNFTLVPIYVPSLKAAVHFGSFLQWVNVVGIRFVGRLIRLVGNADGPSQALQMNVYNLIRTTSPLPPHSLRCLQEIEQTEILSVVAIQSIREISFVLSVDDFSNACHYCFDPLDQCIFGPIQ